MFEALATVAQWRMGGFTPHDLANTAWAFATAGQDALLFTAIAVCNVGDICAAVQERLQSGGARQDSGQKHASLFAALATATQQCGGGFTPQELANTAWAFATAGHDALLFEALAASAG